MTRRVLAGAGVVAAYVAAAIVVSRSGTLVPRVLYDGLAPPAGYRYVSPPPELAADNERPEPGKGLVDVVGKGSSATSISTGDGQMQIVFQKDAFPGRKGEKTINVTIAPMRIPEPADVAGGMRTEGNAYRVSAAYSKSKSAVSIRKEVTAVLRYPAFSTVVVRREGRAWRTLKTQISQASLQLFASSEELGIFATAGTPHTTWTRWVPYGAGALGVIAGAVGFLSGRRGWFRRKRSKPRKRAVPR